jgi:CBS domain-containing protein
MKIHELMTRRPRTIAADDTVENAARFMALYDIGCLPVQKNGLIVGILTDRDIVVRGLAAGLALDQTRVGEIATTRVHYCHADSDSELIAAGMDRLNVHRVPVVSHSKRLVGIVSIEDIRPRC